jgi:hypothetical protein
MSRAGLDAGRQRRYTGRLNGGPNGEGAQAGTRMVVHQEPPEGTARVSEPALHGPAECPEAALQRSVEFELDGQDTREMRE